MSQGRSPAHEEVRIICIPPHLHPLPLKRKDLRALSLEGEGKGEGEELENIDRILRRQL